MTAMSANVQLFTLAHTEIGTILVAKPVETSTLSAVFLGNGRDDVLASLAAYDDLRDARETSTEKLLSHALTVIGAAPQSHAEMADLPIALHGTEFQKRVWYSLRDIPIGETRSYGTLAHGLGLAMGSRAVARACASNRHALLVPCHRVIGAKGSLTGYRWGIERKRLLLERELLIKEAARETIAPRAA